MSQDSQTGPFPSAKSQVRREVLGEPLIRLVAVSLAFFLIAVGLVSVVALLAPQLSPFDEATHADYA